MSPLHPTVSTTVHVDPVACDAYGYCAELLPERVHLDEWGYPVVDGTPLPVDLVLRAEQAARACPRRAVVVLRRRSGPAGAP